MTVYNTRIAPSPTGDMHLGTARTAYFNWLAARATGGKFILRIDDTDQDRHNEDAVKVIYDTMEWLGLDYDQTFRQSQIKDMGIYDRAANDLLKAGLATRLDNGAVALVIPDNMPDSWVDEVAGTVPVTDKAKQVIDGMILVKGDGWPTYHFSTVVDDAFMGINYVIRGKDHIDNTAKHIAIYLQMQKCNSASFVNFTIPKYAHAGLIFKDKKKMSKRDAAASMLNYRDAGYNPDAMLNFMLRMGWGPTVDDKTTAIISRERALELFLTGGAMKNNEASFDQAKLDSFDRKYKAVIEKAKKA